MAAVSAAEGHSLCRWLPGHSIVVTLPSHYCYIVGGCQANCDAAQALGIDAIHFEDAAALRTELQRVGMLP